MVPSLDAALRNLSPRLPLAVGLSGGADSCALLLACAQRWPGQVQAIHIHHGLQPAADDFAAHCRALCTRLQLPLWLQYVNAQPASGQSPEDAARQARYEGFVAAAHASQAQEAIKSIALAHHADDQVETVLLALSRGAGVAGLAAMPAHWRRAGLDWYRPLLQLPGAQLRQWLQARGETWVEDPSNQDLRYTRNRIRAQLLPALEGVFPQLRRTFARSSHNAAQAAELLQELAQQDLLAVGLPPRIAALQSLSAARQANVLRHWLRQQHQSTPSQAQLAQLQQQIAACRTRGHRIELKIARGQVRRTGDCLAFVQ